MNNYKDILKESQLRIEGGADIEDLLFFLRQNEVSKITSIKILVDLGWARLGEAKTIVHESSTWSDVRQRDENFHHNLSGSGSEASGKPK
mgnify:CR=1 FL=1